LDVIGNPYNLHDSSSKQEGSQHWESSPQPVSCPRQMEEDSQHFPRQFCFLYLYMKGKRRVWKGKLSDIPRKLKMNARNQKGIYSQASHAHPEPNCVEAAVLNSSRKFSNEPKSLLISFRRSPDGFPPPPGFIDSQKKSWFHACKKLNMIAMQWFRKIDKNLWLQECMPVLHCWKPEESHPYYTK